MTKQEAIDLIKLRLGSRDDSDLDALIAAELQSSQEELEVTAPYPWFCVSENSLPETTAGEARVVLPADFVAETDEARFELSTDGGVTFSKSLVKGSYDAIRAAYGDTQGEPEAYALIGNRFILGPVPDGVYKLRMIYQGRDVALSTLTAGGTNQWLTIVPQYLVNMAGMAVASWVKDTNALQVFSTFFEKARTSYVALCTEREEANRMRQQEA